MYQIGDKVVYGIHGVCVVADQEERSVFILLWSLLGRREADIWYPPITRRQ